MKMVDLRCTKQYLCTKLLLESSINFTALPLLLGSKRYSISAAAALCVKESAHTKKKKKDQAHLEHVITHIRKLSDVEDTFMLIEE